LINFSSQEREGSLNCCFDEKVETTVNFDEILAQIAELPGPYLFYCEQGDLFSTVLAMAYLMAFKQKNVNVASFSVFAKRNQNCKVCKWLFS